MVRDSEKDGKICAYPGHQDRVFKIYSKSEVKKENQLETCKEKCLNTKDCVAFSIRYDTWCIGCKAPLAKEKGDTLAFKKKIGNENFQNIKISNLI